MPVTIFFCYAHEDEQLLNKLKAQLRPLQRRSVIDVWYDRNISAGTEWEHDIDQHLNNAQIILLLVSPDFMNSDYCYGIEMKRALERHERKEAVVIPIILRHVYWQEEFGKLQVLPTDAKPVIDRHWHSEDEAFFNVVRGIRIVIEKIAASTPVKSVPLQNVQVSSVVEKVNIPTPVKRTVQERVNQMNDRDRSDKFTEHSREVTSVARSRANFFILLGINPNEAWNPAKFKQIHKEKQIEWSRQSTTLGQKASLAKRNLELWKLMPAVMEDETLRAAEADAARAELAQGQKARLEIFEKQVRLLNAKDEIEQKELDVFIEEFKDILTAQEIKEHITAKIRTVQSASFSPQLDATLAKTIAERLHALGMSTLYELLGCSNQTGVALLLQKVDMLYKDLMTSMSIDQERTYKIELVGHAKVVFQSEEKRRQYDESLRQSTIMVLLKELDAFVNRASFKEINLKQTEVFLDDAQKAGWSRGTALEKLKEHARQQKWSIETPKLDAND